MEKPKIAILQEKSNLIGLRSALTRMGFIVELFSGLKAVHLALQDTSLNLYLVDTMITDKQAEFQLLVEGISEVCPVFLVEQGEEGVLLFDRQHKRALQLVDLHYYFLRNLDSYSRKKLRMAVNLPSILTSDHSSQYSPLTWLGTGGAFAKTGYPTPDEGQLLKITISLLGHHAELDVCGRVVYSVSPCLENNYIQGVGISFEEPDESSLKMINDYLSFSLLDIPSFKTSIKEAGNSRCLGSMVARPSDKAITPKLS